MLFSHGLHIPGVSAALLNSNQTIGDCVIACAPRSPFVPDSGCVPLFIGFMFHHRAGILCSLYGLSIGRSIDMYIDERRIGLVDVISTVDLFLA